MIRDQFTLSLPGFDKQIYSHVTCYQYHTSLSFLLSIFQKNTLYSFFFELFLQFVLLISLDQDQSDRFGPMPFTKFKQGYFVFLLLMLMLLDCLMLWLCLLWLFWSLLVVLLFLVLFPPLWMF